MVGAIIVQVYIREFVQKLILQPWWRLDINMKEWAKQIKMLSTILVNSVWSFMACQWLVTSPDIDMQLPDLEVKANAHNEPRGWGKRSTMHEDVMLAVAAWMQRPLLGEEHSARIWHQFVCLGTGLDGRWAEKWFYSGNPDLKTKPGFHMSWKNLMFVLARFRHRKILCS